MSAALKRLNNVHHAAYRCRDAEQTRWFYEDVLGLPYQIAVMEDHISGTDILRPYMHLFFELGDGNYIAFFDDPNSASADHFEHKDSFDYHIAFEVESTEVLQDWKKRIRDANILCFGPVDHEFVQSIYFYDPNGIALEITARPPGHQDVTDKMALSARDQLANWTQKTRDQKIALFGRDELDRREVQKFYEY
jgi:catechol-2,3-dioxygenase